MNAGAALAGVPRATPSGDGQAQAALVGNIDVDVGQRRSAASSKSSSGPGIGLPAGDGPIFLCADFDLGVSRRAHTGDGQLGSAVEKQLDRLAAALFGKVGALDAPAV